MKAAISSASAWPRPKPAPATPCSCPGLRRPDDGAGDRGVAQAPGDGHFPGGAPAPAADLPQQPGQGQVAPQLGLPELQGALAEIVLGHGLDPFDGHGAAEQPGFHGAVYDHPDALGPGSGARLSCSTSGAR